MRRSRGSLFLVFGLLTSVLSVAGPSQALLCVESCVPEPPPPPEPPPGCQYPVGTATVVQTGTVKDPFGSPIAGAKVYNWCKTATTNAAGVFSLLVPVADAGRTVTAKGTVHYYRDKPLPNPVGSAPLNFEGPKSLPFLVSETITVTPDAVNSLSSQVTFRLDATAPVTGARVLLQLPGGGRIVLAHDLAYAQPAGWSRWAATTTLPAGFPLGRQTIYACVLKATALADHGCFGPESEHLISQVRSHAIAYDQSPPAATTSTPAAFSNVTNAPATISVTIADAGGAILADGIFPTRLDGQSVAASRSGDTISLSGAGVDPGVHLVEIDAADTAGNAVTIRTLFTIVTITASGGIATLRSQMIAVNPDGTFPAPTTVTFPSPRADISAFGLTLNATTETGLATVRRSITFPSAVVTFRRPDGLSVDQSASLSTVSEHRIGLVAPSTGPLASEIPAGTSDFPNLVVAVPAEFGGLGTTATLAEGYASAGQPTLDHQDPIVSARPTRLALSIATCLRVTSQCTTGGGKAAASGYFAPLGWTPVAAPAQALPAEDDESVLDPGCQTLDSTPDGNPCGQEPRSDAVDPYACPRNPISPSTKSNRCGQSNLHAANGNRSSWSRASGLSLGCEERLLGIELCSGTADGSEHLAALYQTPFAYSQAGCLIVQSDTCAEDLTDHPSVYLLWHQSKAAPSTTRCPEGYNGNATASLIRLYTTYQPTSDSPYVMEQISTTIGVEESGAPGNSHWAGSIQGDLFRVIHAIPPSESPPPGTNYSIFWNQFPTLDDTVVDAAGIGTSLWPQSVQTHVPTAMNLSMYSGAEFRSLPESSGAASALTRTTAVFELLGCGQ